MLAKRKWSADANCDRSVFDALQSIYSSLAQSVERMTVNHDVVGSSPTGGAKKKDRFRTVFFLSNPKDWYGITRRVHGIRRKATAWHHAIACILLRIDSMHHFVMIPYKALP